MIWNRKKRIDPFEQYVKEQNEDDALQKSEYAKAVSIEGVEPSIEGNKVIFYAPELDTCEQAYASGDTQWIIRARYGSTGLDRNYKWFKNAAGQLYKKEIFETTHICKMRYE